MSITLLNGVYDAVLGCVRLVLLFFFDWDLSVFVPEVRGAEVCEVGWNCGYYYYLIICEGIRRDDATRPQSIFVFCLRVPNIVRRNAPFIVRRIIIVARIAAARLLCFFKLRKMLRLEHPQTSPMLYLHIA